MRMVGGKRMNNLKSFNYILIVYNFIYSSVRYMMKGA